MSQGALKSFVPQVLARIGLNEQKYTFLTVVEQSLPSIGRTAKLVGIKNNLIYIEVESSAEFQEARFKKREVLKALAQAFPGPESASADIRVSLKGASASAPKMIRLNPLAPRKRMRHGV